MCMCEQAWKRTMPQLNAEKKPARRIPRIIRSAASLRLLRLPIPPTRLHVAHKISRKTGLTHARRALSAGKAERRIGIGAKPTSNQMKPNFGLVFLGFESESFSIN